MFLPRGCKRLVSPGHEVLLTDDLSAASHLPVHRNLDTPRNPNVTTANHRTPSVASGLIANQARTYDAVITSLSDSISMLTPRVLSFLSSLSLFHWLLYS